MNLQGDEDPIPGHHLNILWIQLDGTNLIVCVEGDNNGRRSLLRAYYVEREVVGGCDQSFLFKREDGKWFQTTGQICNEIMQAIVGDTGHPDDWEDTIVMMFGSVGVEMKTLVFANDEGSKLMSKMAEESHCAHAVPFVRDKGVADFPVPVS